MDPISGNSLASRVCSSNAGIELSEDKSSAFKALKAYLNHDNGFPIGPAFKCLCILVWCLTVLSDLFSAIKLMTAAYQLRGSQTLIALDASGQRQVKSISKPRLMWFLVVQSIRASWGQFVSGLRWHIVPTWNCRAARSATQCEYVD